MHSREMKSEIRPGADRILIVDDEEIVHLTLKRLLEPEGYAAIDSAYGGEEALSKLDAGYDLLILDIRMPGIDGIEMLREIRKRQLDIEVLVLTGYATMESATQALNYGACGYLMKPIENVLEFRNKVHNAVHIARLARENKRFYDSIVSDQVDSIMVDGKPYKVPVLREENIEIFQRLMEVIRDAVVFLDFDGNITFANVNFAKMLGESFQKLLGSRIDSYIAEQDKDKIIEVLTRISSGQVAVRIPAKLKTRFASPLSVIISASPIYHEMEYCGIVMLISDITEISKAREKVELLASLVENAQYDIICIVTPEGQIMECNSLARCSFGYSQSEMLSMNIGTLFKFESNEGWERIVDSVDRNSHWRGDLPAISKNGKVFPVEMTVSRPVSKANTSVHMICFMRDISERKQAEEALKEGEERYRTLVSNIPGAVYRAAFNPERRTVHFFSDAIQEISGYPASDFIGDKVRSYESVIHPKDAKMVEEMVLDYVSKKIPYELEYRVVCVDDSVRWVHDKGQGVYGENGELLWLDGIVFDITERKQAEEVRLQTEKMSALGVMVAGVAHEMNNPMMGILHFAKYCIKHTSEDDRRYTVLQDIERETKRCATIVKNLLTFSHMGKEGEEAYQKESWAAILDRVLNLLSYRIEKQKVLVTRRIADGTPDIWMKVNNIQQVFLNLINNALDALDGCEKREINADIRREHEFVQVTISDAGCGIQPENLDKIFDPFFTTRSTGQGTGLGLSISQSIIKEHGGKITCESVRGAGTKFTISLPIERRKGAKK